MGAEPDAEGMAERGAPPWMMGLVFFATYLVVSLGVVWWRQGRAAVGDQLVVSTVVATIGGALFAFAVQWWRDRQGENPGSKGPR